MRVLTSAYLVSEMSLTLKFSSFSTTMPTAAELKAKMEASRVAREREEEQLRVVLEAAEKEEARVAAEREERARVAREKREAAKAKKAKAEADGADSDGGTPEERREDDGGAYGELGTGSCWRCRERGAECVWPAG